MPTEFLLYRDPGDSRTHAPTEGGGLYIFVFHVLFSLHLSPCHFEMFQGHLALGTRAWNDRGASSHLIQVEEANSETVRSI